MARPKTDPGPIAEAIRDTFTSPNVLDANYEAANVVDALAEIAEAIRDLADATRGQGDRQAKKERKYV